MDSTNCSHCVLNRKRNGLSRLPFLRSFVVGSHVWAEFFTFLKNLSVDMTDRPDMPEAFFLITQAPNDITSRHAKGRRVTRCQKRHGWANIKKHI